MEANEEGYATGRVTRSRIRRLSVDSESTSRPGTPVGGPKLAAINEDAPTTPSRRTRRNSTSAIAATKTPAKTPKGKASSRAGTPEKSETPTTKRGPRSRAATPEVSSTPKRSTRSRTPLPLDTPDVSSKIVAKTPIFDTVPEEMEVSDTSKKESPPKRVTRGASRSPLEREIAAKKEATVSRRGRRSRTVTPDMFNTPVQHPECPGTPMLNEPEMKQEDIVKKEVLAESSEKDSDSVEPGKQMHASSDTANNTGMKKMQRIPEVKFENITKNDSDLEIIISDSDDDIKKNKSTTTIEILDESVKEVEKLLPSHAMEITGETEEPNKTVPFPTYPLKVEIDTAEEFASEDEMSLQVSMVDIEHDKPTELSGTNNDQAVVDLTQVSETELSKGPKPTLIKEMKEPQALMLLETTEPQVMIVEDESMIEEVEGPIASMLEVSECQEEIIKVAAEVQSSMIKESTEPKPSLVEEAAEPEPSMLEPQPSMIEEAAEIFETSMSEKTAEIPEPSMSEETAEIPEPSMSEEMAEPPQPLMIEETAKPPEPLMIEETAKPPEPLMIEEAAEPHQSLMIEEATEPHQSLMIEEAAEPHQSLIIEEAAQPQHLMVKAAAQPSITEDLAKAQSLMIEDLAKVQSSMIEDLAKAQTSMIEDGAIAQSTIVEDAKVSQVMVAEGESPKEYGETAYEASNNSNVGLKQKDSYKPKVLEVVELESLSPGSFVKAFTNTEKSTSEDMIGVEDTGKDKQTTIIEMVPIAQLDSEGSICKVVDDDIKDTEATGDSALLFKAMYTPTKAKVEIGRSVLFDKNVGSGSPKCVYPKTPALAKSKTNIEVDSSQDDTIELSKTQDTIKEEVEMDKKGEDETLPKNNTPGKVYSKVQSIESSTPLANVGHMKKPRQDLTPVLKVQHEAAGFTEVLKGEDENKEIIQSSPASPDIVNEVENIYTKDTWSQGVCGRVNLDTKLDCITNQNEDEVLKENRCVEVKRDVKRNRNSNIGLNGAKYEPITSDEDELDESEDERDEHEKKYKSHYFVDDKAMEVEDYQSGDSMDTEERLEIEENEIPVDGESIGSEDTDEDESDDEDDSDSFVVSDVEEEILDYSDEDECIKIDKTHKAGKKYRRIIEDTESEDESGTQDAEGILAGKKNVTEQKEISASLDKQKSVDESVDKSSDVQFTSGLEQSSIALNTSKLSETAINLCYTANETNFESSENEEKQVELNMSRKEVLKRLNKSDRFNKTNHELDVNEDTSPEIEVPAPSKEAGMRSSFGRSSAKSETPKKTESFEKGLNDSESSRRLIRRSTDLKRTSTVEGEIGDKSLNDLSKVPEKHSPEVRPCGAQPEQKNLPHSKSNKGGFEKSKSPLVHQEPIPNESQQEENEGDNENLGGSPQPDDVSMDSDGSINEAKFSDAEDTENKIQLKTSLKKNELAKPKGKPEEESESEDSSISKYARTASISSSSSSTSKILKIREKVMKRVLSKSMTETSVKQTSSKLNTSHPSKYSKDKDEFNISVKVIEQDNLDVENDEGEVADQNDQIDRDSQEEDIFNPQNYEVSEDDNEGFQSDTENVRPRTSKRSKDRESVGYGDDYGLEGQNDQIDQEEDIFDPKESEISEDDVEEFQSGTEDVRPRTSKSFSNASIGKYFNRSIQEESSKNNSYTVTLQVTEDEAGKSPKIEVIDTSNPKKDLVNNFEVKKLHHLRKMFNPLSKTHRQSLNVTSSYVSEEDMATNKQIKRLKRQSLGVPSAQDFNPSQSLIETMEARKKLSSPQVISNKRKRLSKSFNGVGSLDTTMEADGGVHHTKKKSKLALDESDSDYDADSFKTAKNVIAKSKIMHSSTPHDKRADDPNNNKYEKVMRRCEEILQTGKQRANDLKQQMKAKGVIKKQKQKRISKKNQGKEINDADEDKEPSTKDLAKEMAVKKALRASAKILMGEIFPAKCGPDLDSDSEVERLPKTKLVSATSPPSDQENRPRLIKSMSGVFIEAPATPKKTQKPKPIETFTNPTGKVTVLPATPIRKNVVRGFVEEPATPKPFSMSRRVQYITSGFQDTPPEVTSKKNKRKRHHDETVDESLIEGANAKKYSHSGRFVEENLYRPVARRGATEFLIAKSNDFDFAATTQRKGRSKHGGVGGVVDTVFNESALKFKHLSAPGSHAQRVASSEILKMRKRHQANNMY